MFIVPSGLRPVDSRYNCPNSPCLPHNSHDLQRSNRTMTSGMRRRCGRAGHSGSKPLAAGSPWPHVQSRHSGDTSSYQLRWDSLAPSGQARHSGSTPLAAGSLWPGVQLCHNEDMLSSQPYWSTLRLRGLAHHSGDNTLPCRSSALRDQDRRISYRSNSMGWYGVQHGRVSGCNSLLEHWPRPGRGSLAVSLNAPD